MRALFRRNAENGAVNGPLPHRETAAVAITSGVGGLIFGVGGIISAYIMSVGGANFGAGADMGQPGSTYFTRASHSSWPGRMGIFWGLVRAAARVYIKFWTVLGKSILPDI